MTPHSDLVDVRRRAGWLPDEQDDLESWFAGHRERVAAPGERVALHPVIAEFQELIDSDRVVRMYMHQMISQVPAKPYRTRHLESVEQFEHDPADEHWGFSSWNDFFTRRFKDGQRPVAAPDDDAVIADACESTPYGIATDVARQDSFWIKSQPYSLQDLLANDQSVDEFVGGTIYQAFLSATNYHRWHSPVAGTIVRAFIKEGTYYSEADSEGSDAVEPAKPMNYWSR